MATTLVFHEWLWRLQRRLFLFFTNDCDDYNGDSSCFSQMTVWLAVINLWNANHQRKRKKNKKQKKTNKLKWSSILSWANFVEAIFSTKESNFAMDNFELRCHTGWRWWILLPSELNIWMSYRQKLCATGVKMVKILSVAHFIVNRLFRRKVWVLLALELLF